jgi:hypothetical protein
MKRRFTILTAALALLTFLAVPMGMWGQTVVTFTPGTDTGATSVTKGDITATMTTMNNASYYQIYANQSGTFTTANGVITKIEFTCTASGTSKYGPGNASSTVGSYSYNEYVGTWTGSETSVTISSTAQVRMSLLKITYTPAGGGQTTTYAVTFDAGDGTFVGNTDFPNASNTVAAGTYTLPSATPATGYTFDGWVATGITTPTTGSYTVSGAVAFTAHYTQNTTSGSATYTITSTSAVSASGQAPSGSSATFSQTYSTKFQMTSGNSMTLTLSGYQGKVVTGITLNMRSNASGGAGWMYAKAGNNTLASIGSENNGVAFSDDQWNGSYTTSYTDVTIGMSDDSYAIQNDENLVIFIKATQNSLYCQSFTITWGNASSITRPQFLPAGGIYTSTQNVTISSETGATIYYTTDGSQPTTSSTLYNGAISIESTTTLKAIAVVNGESSNVVSATYTILNPLTTMQAIFDNATATPASHEVAITFDNWVISGQNGSQTTGSGANKAWLTDNNGKGCSIYYNNHGLMANNVLNGTVICNLQLYNGSAQINGINSTTTDINGNTIVSTGGTITPVETTIGNLAGVNTGVVVKLNHLRCTSAGTSSNTLTDGTNTIYAKKTLYSSLSFEEGKIYDLTGVFEYSSSTSTIYPRSAADVVEAPKATLAIGTLTNVTGLYVFYVYDEDNPIISEGQSSAQQQVYVGEEIKVSPEVAAHCAMQSLTVTDGDNNPVTVTDHMTDGGYYSFIMPSSGASITATASVSQQYTLTVVGDHVSITQLLVGEESEVVNLDANNQASIYEQVEVLVDGITVDAAFMIESVTIEYGNTSVEVTKNSGGLYAFTMPSSNATLTFTTHEVATFTYTKVTSVTPGKHYIIVTSSTDSNGKYHAMGGKNSGGSYMDPIVVSVDNNTVTVAENEGVAEILIDGTVDNYTLHTSEGYLVGGNKSMNTDGTESSTWTISFNTNDQAVITWTINTTGYSIQYNSSSPRFACYSSNQAKVCLYEKVEPATETHILTVTGYADYSAKDGYCLIASPVTVDPADVEGLVVANTDPNYQYFDLYSFANNQDEEWHNYKNTPFDLVPGTGYLYAKKATNEISTYSFELTGTPYSGDGVIELTQGTGNWADWNLVGNPYGVDAEIYNDCYVMNGNGSGIIPAENQIVPAMHGVFVKYAEDEEVAIFEPIDGDGITSVQSENRLVLNLVRNRGTVIDRAIVRFGEGRQMTKFTLFENSTKLYIPQDDEDYAIVRSEAQGELPVSFRAGENGTYTLSMNVENVDMNYLHLIDNMTGMDIDLLQTPSYTFEANTNDYANRFKLVFAANGADEADESSFAFFSNGNLIVNNEGNATLQVIDINGRILSSETISGSCSKAINATTGVYMLRLINGDNVKVQKVVVR